MSRIQVSGKNASDGDALDRSSFVPLYYQLREVLKERIESGQPVRAVRGRPLRHPPRSTVFLVLCTELRAARDGARPFEVARVEYRGDLLQFRLDVSGEAPAVLPRSPERGRRRALR